MGMKEPKGVAKKIGGTVSSPSTVNQYSRMQNGATVAKNIDCSQPIRNTAMPPAKATGVNPATKITEKEGY